MGDLAAARERASHALALAAELGWEEARSSALQTLGSTKVSLGDASGLDDQNEAIECARAVGALSIVSRGYNSLAVSQVELGDLRAASECRSEAARIAAQISSAEESRWYQGVLAEDNYRSGHWEEALGLTDAFLADVDAGSEHYMTGQAAIVRALIRLARRDDPGARADAERAIAHGRTIDDPQVACYLLPLGTSVLSILDAPERTLELAVEFLDVLRRGVVLQFASITLPTFAATARRLDLEADLIEALAEHNPSPWVDAVRAYASGDFVAAADRLHQIGSLPDEAEARLRAAEQFAASGNRGESHHQLGLAIAFFRSVRATRFESECESLLAATA